MAHRDMELRHLAMSDRHLAEGAERIAKQEVILAELDKDGHDTTAAAQLLETFRAVQEEGVKHRRMILEALNEPEDEGVGPG